MGPLLFHPFFVNDFLVCFMFYQESYRIAGQSPFYLLNTLGQLFYSLLVTTRCTKYQFLFLFLKNNHCNYFSIRYAFLSVSFLNKTLLKHQIMMEIIKNQPKKFTCFQSANKFFFNHTKINFVVHIILQLKNTFTVD